MTSDNFAVRFPPGLGADVIGPALADLQGSDPELVLAPADERAIEGLKFAECLPPDLAARVVEARLADARGVGATLVWPTRTVADG